jgi:HlyD family secretion protein
VDKKESKLLGLRAGIQDQSNSSDVSYTSKLKVSNLVFLAVTLFIIGFFIFASWDQLVPPVKVDATSAIAVKSKGNYISKGQISFQAAGWVEPAPLVTMISTLVNGIVKEVKVVEGKTVKKGDIIAVLIDEDLQLDLQEAETELENLKNAILIAKANLKMAYATREHQRTQIKTAEAELAKLENKRAILHRAGYAISKLQREQIVHACNVQKAVLKDTKAEMMIFNAGVTVKSAMVQSAKVKLRQQFVRIERIKLDIRRTEIKSPIDGIIMSLHARVGSKHNIDSDATDAAVIAELYQPEMLQVRVDVPLSDTGGLSVGQETIIELAILPEKFKGKVSSIVGMADIQRNTLQAKVRIENPSIKLRPEMLAKVQFLSMAKKNITDTDERVRIFIPAKSITDKQKNSGKVWVLDRRTGRAGKVNITLGHTKKENWIEVKDGILPGQLVITSNTSNLKEEMRVINSKSHWRNNNETN